jgi:Ca2+-binding RTX toxin-like protein
MKFAALLTIAIAAIAAPTASAAVHLFPNGGSKFDTGLESWTPSGSGDSTGAFDGGVGNPAGSLRARTAVLILTGSGTGTFTSPQFTAPATQQAVAGVAFEVRLHKEALILSASTTISAKLKDLTTPGETEIFSRNVPAFVAPFVDVFIPVVAQVPADKIVPNHNYQLVLSAATSATPGLLANVDVHFDNVALATADPPTATPPPTPPGGGSTGGTVIAPPKSNAAMAALLSGTNVNLESGDPRILGTGINPAQCTIVGTPGKADRIKGTPGNDVICGFDGNDTLDGGGGNDILDGGSGNDRLIGGAGVDGLLGLGGEDRLNGGAGNDRLGGGAGADLVSGFAGNDRLGGGSSKDKLDGSTGNDLIDGGSSADRIAGGKGKDRIGGGSGNDRISARDKTRDQVDGGGGKDTAFVDRLRKTEKRTKAKLRRTDLVIRVERIR